MKTVRAQNKPADLETLMLGYQSRWILDRTRLKIAEKARQIGWTWATAYALVRRKSRNDATLDAWVSSRDELQARLFLKDCKSFADMLHIGAKDLGECVFTEGDKVYSAYVLRFDNGLRIHSMSSNPDAQAGKRGDRVLDEFALHPDPRTLYSIAYPGITWGGQLEMFSTHRGSDNYFNTLIQEIKGDNPKGFSLHTVTLQDALDDGFLFKLQQKLPKDDERQDMVEADYFDFTRSQCADEDTFNQEYMCKPSDDATAFLGYDEIGKCYFDVDEAKVECDWSLQKLSRVNNPLYFGLDMGRKNDLSDLYVFEHVGGVLVERAHESLQNRTFREQKSTFWPYFELPQMRRGQIDNTGLGMQFAEEAQERFGSFKVEAVTFTNQAKSDLAYGLRTRIEDVRIRFKRTPKVESALRAIKKETTSTGAIRFAADRGPGGHADEFWSMAMTVGAAAGKDGGTDFEPITQRGRVANRRTSGGIM